MELLFAQFLNLERFNVEGPPLVSYYCTPRDPRQGHYNEILEKGQTKADVSALSRGECPEASEEAPRARGQ